MESDERAMLAASGVELVGEELEWEVESSLVRTEPLSEMRSAVKVLKQIWKLGLVSVAFHSLMIFETHINMPYLYTRVHCCDGVTGLDERYNISEPAEVAAILHEAFELGLAVDDLQHFDGGNIIPACSVPAFPRSSRMWSLSPACVNKAFVEDSAQRIPVVVKPLQKIAGLIVLPMGGTAADGVGRRPVLATYAFVIMISCTLLAIDSGFSRLHGLFGDLVVYIACVLLCVIYQPKDSILSGAIADRIGNVAESKQRAFSALLSLNLFVEILINSFVYVYLKKHLPNYGLSWMGCAVGSSATMLLIYGALPESLPLKLRGKLTSGMLNPVRTQVQVLKLVLRDPVLVQLALTVFMFFAYWLGFTIIHTSYLVQVGFSLEATQLPQIIANIAQFLFSSAMVKLLPRISPCRACTYGHALYSLAYFLWGAVTVSLGQIGPYLAYVTQGIAYAVLIPSWQTIISQRVEEHNQSKCQAAISAMGTVGVIFGVPLYTKLLFRATAQGIYRAIPATVSMCLSFLCCLLSFRMEAQAKAVPPSMNVELYILDS